ncbi:MAG: hypothetical protein QM755_23775 [Luteolibacter sp.]
MKRAIAILSTIAAGFATLAGLDMTGFTAVLPPDVAKWLVIVPSASAAIVHFINAIVGSLKASDTPTQ